MTTTLPPFTDVPPPPPAPSRWRVSPGPAVLGALGLGGIAFDLLLRHPTGLVWFIALTLMVGASLLGGWVIGRAAHLTLLSALVPALFLVIRDSPWLVPFNLLAGLALIIVAAAMREEPHAFGRAVARLLRPSALAHPLVRGPELVARSLHATGADHEGSLRQLTRLGLGVLVALPVVGVLLALLATSDALFRSWLTSPIGVTDTIGHIMLILFGAAFFVIPATHGAWRRTRSVPAPNLWLGSAESAIVLAGIAAVYLAFVASQVIAVAAGADYVERSTGLTYSEYARAGFFQLVAAAVVALCVLLLLARYRRPGPAERQRHLRLLETTTIVLILVSVGVAIRRLTLYEAAQGLTMLRLTTMVFASFIGFVFVVVGLHLAGRLRPHPTGVITVGALVVLLGLDLLNPEAVVANRNISRFGGTALFDVDYHVGQLGADAIPAMLTDPQIAAALCARQPEIDDRAVVFNHGRSEAAAALRAACTG